jgi:hypothetical protein
MKSSLIEIKIGNPIMHIEDNRIGILRDIRLSPNGINDPTIIAILFVEFNGQRGMSVMSATSNKFTPVDYHTYPEFYPGVHLKTINTKIA